MLVNPVEHPNVREGLGPKFIDYLISPEGQRAIAGFKVDGQRLLFPDANDTGPEGAPELTKVWRPGRSSNGRVRLGNIIASRLPAPSRTRRLTAAEIGDPVWDPCTAERINGNA